VGVKVIWGGWVRALVPFDFAQGRGGRAEQAAEEHMLVAPGLKPRIQSRAVTAALEALRHPKAKFFRSL